MINNNPIIIAGSGRSGTTWVLDSIAEANNLRTIFEPFNPMAVPFAKAYANRYLRDDADQPELKLFLDKVFSGRHKSLWANYRIHPDRLYPDYYKSGSLKDRLASFKSNYKKLFVHFFKYHKVKSGNIIVKFIRTNLMLGWISKNYSPRVLLLLRHPGAVIASKLNLGGPNWQHEIILKQYKENKQLLDDYLYRFKDAFRRSLSPVAAHTVIWCIENALPIANAEKNGYFVVYYENLIANPEIEWKRIINTFGLKHLPGNEMLSQPSQQVSREMKEEIFDLNQISRWTKKFNQQQLDEIDQILNIFGISIYRTTDPMPRCDVKNV